MKMEIFAVLDDKSGLYGFVRFHINANVAIRNFSDMVNTPDSVFGKHPGDYHLYKLGVFDDVSGEFASAPKPEFVIHAINLINNNPVDPTTA